MRKTAKHSSLFLLELIVAILFFALAGAVCLQVYAGSYAKSREARDLSYSQLLGESAAELLYGYNGDLKEICVADPQYSVREDRAVAFFDREWRSTRRGRAEFMLWAEGPVSDNFMQGNVQVVNLSTNKILFSLKIQKYLPHGR